MKELPAGAVRYGGTSVVSEESTPANLRRAHRTKAGTWAWIVVLEGRLRCRILEPGIEEIELTLGRPGIVEPEALPEVEALRPVRFRVDFYH